MGEHLFFKDLQAIQSETCRFWDSRAQLASLVEDLPIVTWPLVGLRNYTDVDPRLLKMVEREMIQL